MLKNRIKNFIKIFGVNISKNHPVSWIKIIYFLRFKKFLNLKNPKNLNEKILYLSLKTDTTKWTELSDKYLVRNYVKEQIGEDKLVKLYGVWDNPNKIDLKNLPPSFILKTNHGSGDNLIVNNKSEIDKSSLNQIFPNLNKPYFGNGAEKHYEKIKPLIIAEELLENDEESSKYSSSIIDYKCWCFNGKCEYIWVCTNRTKSGFNIMLYDKDWVAHPEFLSLNKFYKRGVIMPRPNNINEVIATVEKLAKPFPCVRVDLYLIKNKIYFGEMTFTSHGGMMVSYTQEFLNKAGQLIDVNYSF